MLNLGSVAQLHPSPWWLLMSRWGYSWRWKEGTCNHANWVQIGLVDDSFITPPRGFLTAQLPANFATVVSHRSQSHSMATITFQCRVTLFQPRFQPVRGPLPLRSLFFHRYFYTPGSYKRFDSTNLPHYLFFFFFFSPITSNPYN